MRTPIVIDTDPGQDDAIAILAAFGCPDLEVLGLTCVAGNVPLHRTVRNARLLCELAGRTDVPVLAGAPRPLVRPLVTAEAIHGETGMDGPDWWEPTMPVTDGHAADWLVRTLRAAPEPVTICALGPLTNVALALLQAPDVADRIERIVLMGGAYWQGGNRTPVAEFNILVDPHAAAHVFACGRPVVVHSLDLTYRTLTSEAWIGEIAGLGTPVGDAAAAMLRHYQRHDPARYGGDGGPLHDPNVIAWVARPDLYGGREVAVSVECTSELTMGQTVVDWWGVGGDVANATWVETVDADGYFGFLADCLGRR